ncbi:hypothetical protein JCM14036_15940 [Desulfotomaculum defluvii]
MDSIWILLLVLLALAALVFFLLPHANKTTGEMKKPELPKRTQEEEFAKEISPDVPQIIHTKSEFQVEVEEEPFIPHHYGVNRLVAVARDPNWLYVYWEVNDEIKREFFQLYGEKAWNSSHQVLKVYDVTKSSKEENKRYFFREITIDPFADNWFVEVGQPEHSFFLELGRVLSDGRYIKLLTSNPVTTPRASISERMDAEWMWIDGIYQGIYKGMNNGRIPYGFSSSMLAGMGMESLGGSSQEQNN